MNTKEILIAAKALIDTPDKWSQDNFVDEKDGKVCYCMAGAVLTAQGAEKGALADSFNNDFWANNALIALSKSLPGPASLDSRIPFFNDCEETTHKEVMQAFDHAIKECDNAPSLD